MKIDVLTTRVGVSCSYNPVGQEFYDAASGHRMKYVKEGTWKGWLCWLHPDNLWVSLREATKDDLIRIRQMGERCECWDSHIDADVSEDTCSCRCHRVGEFKMSKNHE